MPIFAIPNGNGVVAQMVEQWTENPCVGSSILPDTTPKPRRMSSTRLFCILSVPYLNPGLKFTISVSLSLSDQYLAESSKKGTVLSSDSF